MSDIQIIAIVVLIIIVDVVTSNGTPCDHLYEVLDAFTVYPKLVNAIAGNAIIVTPFL